MTRPQTTTLGELRASGVHGLPICCGNYCCAYSIGIESKTSSPALCAVRAGPTSGPTST